MTELNVISSPRPWPTGRSCDETLHCIACWATPIYAFLSWSASYLYTHKRRIQAVSLGLSQGATLILCIRHDQKVTYSLTTRRIRILSHNLTQIQLALLSGYIEETNAEGIAGRLCADLDDSRRRELDARMIASGYCSVADTLCYPVQPIALCSLQRLIYEGDSQQLVRFLQNNQDLQKLLADRLEQLNTATHNHLNAKRDPRLATYYRRLFGLVSTIALYPLFKHLYRSCRWPHSWARFCIWN